ncbi:hypothetical protein EH221_06245 [bacterium]|nr:MAG: hypothetical protein EH221_06245 [bacterium]
MYKDKTIHLSIQPQHFEHAGGSRESCLRWYSIAEMSIPFTTHRADVLCGRTPVHLLQGRRFKPK